MRMGFAEKERKVRDTCFIVTYDYCDSIANEVSSASYIFFSSQVNFHPTEGYLLNMNSKYLMI